METGERVGKELLRIAADNPGETIVVAAHGTAIQMAVGHILGWDYAHTIALGSLANCSWSILDHHHSTWRLTSYNVTAPKVEAYVADETVWGDPRIDDDHVEAPMTVQ
jgi:broad specificity phosphatase PhoE